MTPDSDIPARLLGWLDGFVVAENLCPFAGHALRAGQVEVGVEQGGLEAVLERLAHDAQRLVAPGSDPEATLLLALTAAEFADLDDYLDLIGIADALLDSLSLRGEVQLASFHPDYLFEGEPPGDPSHWTNRAPWPLLHLLREDAVERAVARHPDPDAIPVRNVAHLRALGIDEVRRRVQATAGRGTVATPERTA